MNVKNAMIKTKGLRAASLVHSNPGRCPGINEDAIWSTGALKGQAIILSDGLIIFAKKSFD